MTPERDILEARIRKAKAGDRHMLDSLAHLVSHNLTSPVCESQRFEFLKSFIEISHGIEDVDEYTNAYFTAVCNVATACVWQIEDELRKDNDLKFLQENEKKLVPIMRALSGVSRTFADLKAESIDSQTTTEEFVKNFTILLNLRIASRRWGSNNKFVLTPYGGELLKKLAAKPK